MADRKVWIVLGGVLAIVAFGIASLLKGRSDVEEPLVEEVQVAPAIQGVVKTPFGDPVVGAKVLVGGEEMALTDESGGFTLGVEVVKSQESEGGEQSQKLVLNVEHSAYIVPGPGGLGALTLTHTGEPVSDLELVVRQPAKLKGRVVAGSKAIKATVGLTYTSANGLSGQIGPFAYADMTQTDELGRFDLPRIAPGRLRVSVSADGYSYTESRELELEDGQSLNDLVIDLSPGGALVGDVLDTDGRPISGATLVASGGGLDRPRRFLSSPDGAFRADALPRGDLQIRASAPGFASQTLNVEIGEGLQNLDVVLDRASGYLGVVLDHLGTPTSPVWIYGLEKVATNQQTGRFELPLNAQGSANPELTFISPFHPPLKTSVSPGEETTVQFEDGGYIEGRVVDERGRGIAAYMVGITGHQVEQPAPYAATIFPTNPIHHSDGVFRYGPLRTGKYTVGAMVQGVGRGESKLIEVQAGRTVGGVEIEIATGGEIRGTVHAADGKPLAKARIDLFEPTSQFRVQPVFTNASGEFVLKGVPAGRRSVRASLQGYTAALAAGLMVSGDAPVSTKIVLEPHEPGAQLQFAGIGAMLQNTDDGVVVQGLMDGHPAALSGLKPGDRILSVDGESAQDLRLDSVVELIRGQEGVPVTIEVMRDSGLQRVEINRGKVSVKREVRRRPAKP